MTNTPKTYKTEIDFSADWEIPVQEKYIFQFFMYMGLNYIPLMMESLLPQSSDILYRKNYAWNK